MRAAYATVVALARIAAQIAPPGDSKLLQSLRARRGVVERIARQARAVRDPSRPLVWLHAPSVGEGLQARPVAHALRKTHPDWQIAYTFFSPSAERFAATVGADITEYLPFDSAADADAVLDALRPSVLVFAKLDVWPTLVARAAARGVPVALISGTVAERSGRRGWWSRQLVHDAYASLAAVGAIDADHGARLVQLGAAAASVQVTGDTRFDQVAARASDVDRRAPLMVALASTRPTVVAGSTWPADEAVLFPAWNTLLHQSGLSDRARRPRLLIAPHEPTAAHCAPIVSWATRAGLSVHRVSELSTSESVAAAAAPIDADVVLIDRVGMLGDLYALAEVAFVGGGFHAAGLHSAIEPAAFGTPVMFGPGHDMSREAGLLLTARAAVSVATAEELATQLTHWLSNDNARRQAGDAARAIVERERGATARSAQLIDALVAR